MMNEEEVEALGLLLRKTDRPLKERFRALFALRNVSSTSLMPLVMKHLSGALMEDDSDLLKHEVAFCLGQMGSKEAISILRATVESEKQAVIVRHEAAEALGALGRTEDIELLQRFLDRHDVASEIRETCHLAIKRIQFYQHNPDADRKLPPNPYKSVDPAPALHEMNSNRLRQLLLDEKSDLFDRYRAMFTLRNMGTDEAVHILAEGLRKGSSVLFRHEIAYVLGQMQRPEANECLIEALRNNKEHEIVRHECAEALGSIASNEVVEEELGKYLNNKEPRVLRESCEIALDMCAYENSPELKFVHS